MNSTASTVDIIPRTKNRIFSTEEYSRLVDSGFFTEDERIELIAGEIKQMAPIGSRHVECVNRLILLFAPLMAARQVIVSVQNPILLDEYSQPQPDLTVARYREDVYRGTLPAPADMLFLVEVSDSSDEYDRTEKVPLYARAGIEETWLINLNRGVIEVYRRPGANGYDEFRAWPSNERLSPLFLPDFQFFPSEIMA
jgi:Uma2 family endonuclease